MAVEQPRQSVGRSLEWPTHRAWARPSFDRRSPPLALIHLPTSRRSWGAANEVENVPNEFRSNWRRERDSNPRYGFPYTHFPGVRLQPLGHPSATFARGECVVSTMRAGRLRARTALRPHRRAAPGGACGARGRAHAPPARRTWPWPRRPPGDTTSTARLIAHAMASARPSAGSQRPRCRLARVSSHPTRRTNGHSRAR